MLCAVGCILRMLGSPIVCVFVLSMQGEDLYLRIILNIKKVVSNFFFFLRKKSSVGLLGNVSLMRRSRPGVRS